MDDWTKSSLKARSVEGLSYDRTIGVDGFREMIRTNDEDCSAIRTVIHLGACSSTTEKDEDFLHDNNFLYTRELCEWSLGNQARFVYASSAATYGDGSAGMDDLDEDLSRLEPLNPYGWSKHKFDLWAKEQGVLDQIVGLKYFNVFGPNEEHKEFMRSVVSKSFEQISNSGEMTLFKSHRSEYRDGEQRRDFLYVKDAVNMTIWLAQNLESKVFSTWEMEWPGLGSIWVRLFLPLLARSLGFVSWKCPKSSGKSISISLRLKSKSFDSVDIGMRCFHLRKRCETMSRPIWCPT